MARELVGQSEVAQMAGVTRQVVGNWRKRGLGFPAPQANLQSGPVFDRREVEFWLRTRGKEVTELINGAPTRRRKQLRHFLYNDVALVRDFLAQFEDGNYAEEQLEEQAGGSHELSGGAHIPVLNLGASGKQDQRTTSSRVMHQTPASEFSRLYDRLDDEDMVAVLNGFDETVWEDLAVGEIVELPVVIKTPGVFQLLELGATWSALMPAISNFGGGQPIDPNVETIMTMMSGMHRALQDQPATVICTAAGLPKVRLMATLKRQHILAPTKELEGSATMLAKIQRKLRRTDEASALDDLGLPTAQRREFDKAVGKPSIPGYEFNESTIKGPGAVVTAIAIYR